MSWSKKLEEFIQQESFSGIILIFSTLAALILKNSPWSDSYNTFLHTPVEVRFGALQIHKPLLLWVNDGLMAVFFLLIGLEVKREILEGELSSWNQVALPGIAALGGMLISALVFIGFNFDRDRLYDEPLYRYPGLPGYAGIPICRQAGHPDRVLFFRNGWLYRVEKNLLHGA